MKLAAQQAIGLRQQKLTLQREFADWRERTQEGKQLEKHCTQVLAITAKLEGFLDKIGEPDETAADAFEENHRIHRLLLGAHRIWAYFRSKLALRDVSWLADDLQCADELAWECYRPARVKAEAADSIAKGDLKEPPLVFFSNDASPFSQARHSIFEPEFIKQQGDAGKLGLAILQLPIPVIGIPWFQVDHLPTAVVIAHEVGHAVEHDFGLGTALKDAFAALPVPTCRRPGWLSWRHELFADAYGVLCTGPAFSRALMDFLAADPKRIQQEEVAAPDWGRYPNRFLRMLVNFELLGQLGIPDAGLGKLWKDAYLFHQMQAFEQDIAAVVSALLETVFPTFGATLKQVVSFGHADQSRVEDLASDIIAGIEMPKNEPFRKLYAATTIAYFQDAKTYEENNTAMPLIARMLDAIPDGVRSAEPEPPEDREAEMEAIYRPTGGELMGILAD